jgi:predicted PurR-regulated permease PerM
LAKEHAFNKKIRVSCITIIILLAIITVVIPSLSYQSQVTDNGSSTRSYSLNRNNNNDNLNLVGNDANNNSSNSNSRIQIQDFTADSKPYGLTYGEWTAKWWQRTYLPVPKDVNPAYDDSGKYCSNGQSDPE